MTPQEFKAWFDGFTEESGSIVRSLKALVSWRHVGDVGVWSYFENDVTGERKAVKRASLHGPKHWQWLEGGAWERETPRFPPFPKSVVW